MMSQEIIAEVLRALNEIGCPYMVVGSLSANVYWRAPFNSGCGPGCGRSTWRHRAGD